MLKFVRSDEVQALLTRASVAAGMPLSLHAVTGEQESPRIVSKGRCDACAHVAKTRGGRAACEKSRLPASLDALRTGHPWPFVCHMGFACVCIAVLPEADADGVLTLGPYCPAEANKSLDNDALRGLAKLTKERQVELPFALDDIHLAPADSVPAMAEWIRDDLASLWREANAPLPPEPPPDTATTKGKRPKRRGDKRFSEAYNAADLLAALAGNNRGEARKLIRGALDECPTGARAVVIRRARAVAIAGAVLEAAERAGFDTTACWERIVALPTSVTDLKKDTELTRAVLTTVESLQRKPRSQGDYTALDRILSARLAEKITLTEVAKALGVKPNTLTRRLDRQLGKTFLQYLASRRVDHAKVLLRETNLSVGEVGRRVGIADPGNFSKLFRKFVFMSPSAYRAQFRSKQ